MASPPFNPPHPTLSFPHPPPPHTCKTFAPPLVTAASGSLAGAVEACCLQPIDSIKTRLQLDTRSQYNGILSCAKSIVHQEGILSLWKGLTPYCAHLVLKHTMRMGSNTMLQSAFRDPNTGELRHAHRIASGFGAGILEALLIVTPCEVVKIRLQQQRGRMASETLAYNGPIHCAITIVHEEGTRGLWAGATPTMMRNGINQAVMFNLKNFADSWLWGKQDGDACILQPWQSMLSGFIAGCIGPICTGPFDVVKTRLMAQKRKDNKGSPCMCYKGMFDALKSIYKGEGLCALWKGLLPRLLKIPPGQAIMWTVADQVIGLYETNVSSKEMR